MDRKLLAIAFIALLAASPAHAQSSLAANAGPDKTVNLGEGVTFDGTGSTGNVAQHLWDFGDGTTGTGPTVTKTYAASGTFTVTLVLLGTNGQTSAPDTASVVVRPSDTTAPNLTHTPPTGTYVPGGNIPFSVTVTDNVGVSSAKIFFRSDTETTYNEATMACSGSLTNKTCEATLTNVTASVLRYYLRAQDTREGTPNVGLYPAAAPASNLTLTLSDSAAPTVTHTAPTRGTSGQDITLTATIADTVGATAATAYYAFAASEAALASTSVSEASSSVTMTRSSGTATSGTWTATIPVASAGTARYVRYFLKASDAASNNGTSPANAPASNHTVGISNGTAPTVNHTAVTTATAGAGLTISATVTNTGQTIQSVTLYYNNSGGSTFTSLDMPGLGLANSTTIPGEAIGDRGLRYYIRAANTNGDTTDYPSGGANDPITVATPPAQVAGLAIARGADDAPSLSWTAQTSAALSSVAGYRVHRSTDNASFASIGTTTSASYTDTAATAGVLYHYRVTAHDNFSAEGAASSVMSAGRRPEPPTDLAATPTAPGNLSLSWSTKTGAAWYVVEASIDGGAYAQAANVTTGATTLTGLTNGVPVSVRVSPYASFAQTRGPGNVATATPIGFPLAPGSLAGARGSATSVTLTWTAPGAAGPATSYVVQRSTTSASTGFADLGNATGLSFTDTSAPDAAVHYRVLGVNALGRGAPTDAITVAVFVPPTSGGSTGGGATGGTTTGGTTTDGATGGSATPTPTTPTPVTSTPAPSGPAATTPAPSTPAASTPPASTPVATTPAASTPAASTPAASTPAGSTPASATPPASPTPAETPRGGGGIPGFELVALALAAGAAAYVLRRRA